MDKSIYTYILRHTKTDQVWLILLTVASMPLVYAVLEIPKIIINDAIGGGGAVFDVFGYALTQTQYLLLLSGAYLGMVVITGGLKYFISVYRGVLGERMLRRFRYMLYHRILRFPLPHFKNLSASEIIPMVTAETEPLGGFIGDSIALPAMQGGLLITYLSFIFVQDFWLGLASIALYPPQIYLIPRLQHKVNQLSKRRVQNVRKLADHIGESVAGIADIHTNDTSHFERAVVSRRLGEIFSIRNEIYQRKFFIKFLNNFLAQLTPFFFFSIGGYLVLQNQLSLGALVAVLAAYKDISPPWKELLKFYQITEDVKVKYAQIIEQFAPAGMLAHNLQEVTPAQQQPQSQQQPQPPLHGKIRASRLNYVEDSATQVEQFEFEFSNDRHIAILSKDGTSSDELTQLLARLLTPSSGSLHIGQADLHTLPEAVTGQRIGYCSATARLFNASIRDNLYYGLKHQPLTAQQTQNESVAAAAQNEATQADAEAEASKQDLRETIASGNSTQNTDANWINIHLTGAADQAEFKQIVHTIIECVELDDELLTLALRATADLDIPPQLAEQIVTLRDQLIAQINNLEASPIIEPLHADHYIDNLTVAENLLFGAPADGLSAAEFLATNPLVGKILHRSGLQQDLSEIGLELASLMVELFSDVPDDSELFDQFSFIQADDLAEYQRLVTVTNATGGGANMNAAQRAKLVAVSLQLCPARHRLDLLTPAIQQKVVAARKTLIEELGVDNDHLRFFDKNKYNYNMSVQENLLFGRIMHAKGHLQPRVTETIKNTLKSTNLNQAILLAGLNCPSGAGGAKLSSIVRQKLTLARALLKNTDILILHNVLAGLDGKSFARIVDRILKLRAGRNLIWAFNDPTLLARFDQVLLLENHKLLHNDSAASLAKVIEDL